MNDNQLIVRNIDLDFIPGKYLERLEEEIIEAYIAGMEHNHIPCINEHIMYGVSPVFQAAGLLWSESGKENEFDRVLKETGEEELDLALEIVDDYTTFDNYEYYARMGFEHEYLSDIEEVLRFHNMCFINPEYEPFTLRITNWIVNSPIVEVW